MTVVGLQKNTIDTLSTISGGSNGVNNVANSGTKDFLQILTLLADQSISDVDGVEETSLLHLPTNLKLDADKALKISSQLHIGQDKLEDTMNSLKALMASKSESIGETIIQILNGENDPSFSEGLQEINAYTSTDSNITSLYGSEIRKIGSALDSFKTILDGSTGDIFDNQDVVKNLGNNSSSISERNNNFFDLFYAHSPELNETLNLKILDDPGKNVVFLESSEFKNNEDQPFVKFFMKAKPDFSNGTSNGEIAKVSIEVGSQYSDIELITTGLTSKIESTRLVNPLEEDVIGLEIDKSKVEAIALSISIKKSDSSDRNLGSIVNQLPKIALAFDQAPVSANGLGPSTVSTNRLGPGIKVIPSLYDLGIGSGIDKEKTTYNLVSNDISNTGIGKLESVSKLEVATAIDATTKFSELGALVINLDRKQMKNAIDGISSNLALLNAKELAALSAHNSLSEKVKISQQQEPLKHSASLVAFKAFNNNASSVRSVLLSSTSNVLKYREGIEKFTPNNLFSESYLSIKDNEFENISILSNNPAKELVLGENSSLFSKNAESNTLSSNSVQLQGQANVLISGNQNNSQAPMVYTTSNSIANSTNALHVFDAQFNSRLGMLLTESVAQGRENFELQLEPESFGKVRVSVSLENASLEVKLVAENTGAVSVLRSAEGLLQNIADQSGLKLSEYSVEMQTGGENNKQSNNNEKRNSNNTNINSSKTEEIKESDLNSTNENGDQVLNLLA